MSYTVHCPFCQKTFRVDIRRSDDHEYAAISPIGEQVSYDEFIAEMRTKGYTLEMIGHMLGVSRERVRQLLDKRLSGTTRGGYTLTEVCKLVGCSDERLHRLRREGLVIPQRYGGIWCYTADDIEKIRQILGDRSHHITLTCEECKQAFTIWRSDYRSRLRKRRVQGFFCGRRCYGKFLSRYRNMKRKNPEMTLESFINESE